MAEAVLIRGGRVLDPACGRDEQVDVLIRGDQIERIGGEIEAPVDANWDIIDARGLLVTPGLIDPHVHLRQPGFEDKETVKTGSYAAAAGGFTTIVAMPNTNPVIDSMADVFNIEHIAKERAIVRVHTAGAVTKGLRGEEIVEFGDMRRAGAVAFTDDGLPVWDSAIMLRALQYTSMFDVPVMQHAEDLRISGGHVMHAGLISAKLGLPGYPSAAEACVIARDVELAAMSGGRLHVQHVSAARSVEIIRDAKARGVRVTAEAAPHHLCLTDEAVLGFNTNARMNPPLRSKEDREALREGVRDGTLDCVATDHAPHTAMEKSLPFLEAPNGVIGLENSFAACYTHLVEPGLLDLTTLITRMTVGPAEAVPALAKRGRLVEGGAADVTLIDLDAERVVSEDTYKSKSKNSPFIGHTLRGWPVMTICGGRKAYANGEVFPLDKSR